MKLNLGETVLRINISFAAVVTLTLIIDESGLCATAFFCCIVHEAGHIICLILLGEKPDLIELSFYGVKLERKNVCAKNTDEIAVYASGPLANFALSGLLFAFSHTNGMKAAALTSLCVGAFNLLPCMPLDGGNLLRFFLCRLMSEEKCGKISFYVSVAVLVPMSAAGIMLAFMSENFTLAAVSAYLAFVCYTERKKSALS